MPSRVCTLFVEINRQGLDTFSALVALGSNFVEKGIGVTVWWVLFRGQDSMWCFDCSFVRERVLYHWVYLQRKICHRFLL